LTRRGSSSRPLQSLATKWRKHSTVSGGIQPAVFLDALTELERKKRKEKRKEKKQKTNKKDNNIIYYNIKIIIINKKCKYKYKYKFEESINYNSLLIFHLLPRFLIYSHILDFTYQASRKWSESIAQSRSSICIPLPNSVLTPFSWCCQCDQGAESKHF
jgi:hypothetical protein